MIHSINGKTKVLAVIGNPIEHSLSPQIHNTLCKELGLNYVYVPFKVETAFLEEAVKGFKAAGMLGFNVTIPHKQNIMPYLDEITPEAELMEAVNTVKISEGRLIGYNTDGIGFIRSLKANDVDVKEKKVVIIGAGGASRGIAVKMALEGAAEIIILNRTLEKAQEISHVINSKIKKIAKADHMNQEILFHYANNCDIFINTTPIGMYPHENDCPIEDMNFLTENTVVCDLIYNPKKTVFLKKAEEKGCKIINGWGMLLYQAIEAFEIWTGITVNKGIIDLLYNIN